MQELEEGTGPLGRDMTVLQVQQHPVIFWLMASWINVLCRPNDNLILPWNRYELPPAKKGMATAGGRRKHASKAALLRGVSGLPEATCTEFLASRRN